MDWTAAHATGGRGRNAQGIAYETHTDRGLYRRLPEGVPRDVTIFSVRASLRFRIFGYRAGGIGHILWFIRDHDP
jgi:hypothetical protein